MGLIAMAISKNLEIGIARQLGPLIGKSRKR